MGRHCRRVALAGAAFRGDKREAFHGRLTLQIIDMSLDRRRDKETMGQPLGPL